jgi:hypothetical protein
VGRDLEDLADDDARQGRAGRRHAGHLDPGHGQPLGDDVGRRVRLDELREPAEGDLQRGSPLV